MRLFVVLAIALPVVLAGCSLAPGTSTTTADGASVPTGADAASTYGDLGNVTGDLRVRVAYGTETSTASFRFTADVGTRKIRQRVTAPANRSGNLFASNANAYWRYNASRDVAAKYPHGESTFSSTFGTGRQGYGDFLAAALDAAASDERETVSDLPQVGVGPAPTVPGGDDGDAWRTPAVRPTANVSEYVVEYRGTESIAGRDTYVLRVEPADPDAVDVENLSITYRVDRETYFPVQVEREARVSGESWRQVLTFSNLEFDAAVPASTYEFDPGPDTDVLDYASGVVRFETREALAANASVPVPEPTVPDGFEFTQGAGIELRTSGAQVVYSNDSTVLIAGRYVDDGIITDRERDVAEDLTVNGHRARYVDLGRTQAVYVYCGEYVVSGASVGEVPRETVVELAASLTCGDDETEEETASDDWTEWTRSGLAVQRVHDARQAGELRAAHR